MRSSTELQFDLRLPVSTWTGRYVQEGCGGYCGAVSPAPALAANCPAVTGNELALATDNEGHAGASAFDALWAAGDPGMRISYAYTSEHDIIVYQGWADSAISPFGTVAYYSAVARAAGGYAASQAFSRLYMIPAQYYCLGGGTPQVTGDLLTPLMNWVEEGAAPGAQTFSVVSPATSLKSITVSPLNPGQPVTGHGLNDSYPWAGAFRGGTELWCTADGMTVACRRR
jgi:hypothetical protein